MLGTIDRRAVGLALGLGLLLLLSSTSAQAHDPADLSFCSEVRDVEVDGAPVGHLCILTPSQTDPSGLMLDLDPDCTMEGGVCVAGNGYGNHVIGIPDTLSATSRVALVISGAYGAPHSPILQDHLGIEPNTEGDIRYQATLEDAMATGHLVLQPAYRNPSSVNGDICDLAADPVAGSNPFCHFLIRTLVLEGEQRCPNGVPCSTIPHLNLDPTLTLDRANAYFERLDRLLAYLLAAQTPLQWPTALSPFDWSSLRLVGHSQGSGHAHLISSLLHEVDRACYLGGPRDWIRAEERFAYWFHSYPGSSRTSKDDRRGLVSTTDGWRAIESAWNHIGLFRGAHGRLVLDPDGNGDGHEDIIALRAHGPQRIWACFSDTPLAADVPALPAVAWWGLGGSLLALGAAFGRR